MMTVLLITRFATMDSVISAVNVITATMELTEPAVRAEMDTLLKRAVIARVLSDQPQYLLLLHRRERQVMCSINVRKTCLNTG